MIRLRGASSPRGRTAGARVTGQLSVRRGSLCGMFLVLVMLSNGWAYRPFVSTDAAVADPQEVEIEFGYVTFAHDAGDNTLTTPSLVLNYGLGWNLEVVGEFGLERASRGDLNLIDPGLSLKAVLKEGLLQGKPSLSVAVEAGPLLPSTRPGERGVGAEGIGIVSGKVAPLTLHVNLGGGVERSDAQPFGIRGVIGELTVRSHLRLVGEVSGESSRGALPNNSALLGVLWQPTASNLVFHAGVRRGISRGAPDWQVTAGMTVGFRLPFVSQDAIRLQRP